MKNLATLMLFLLIHVSNVLATGVDYTSRSYIDTSCELFARDASIAAINFRHGIELNQILVVVDDAPVSESEKDRVFQAIQLVWNNRIDNEVLAYSIAMGLCLKPKQQMAPLDEPWITSPRTINGNF